MSSSYFDTVVEQWTNIFESSTRLLSSYATDAEYSRDLFEDPVGLGSTCALAWERILGNLDRVCDHQVKLASRYFQLQSYALEQAMGFNPDPVAAPQADDRRFRADDWRDVLWFDLLHQAYLITAGTIIACTEELADGSDQPGQKLLFYTRQCVDALAPSNYPETNPQVIVETINTGGLNLLSGLAALLEDLERGRGRPAIRMTDSGAFELGRNIAVTPGKVIFQNELMQLLQYSPVTETVFQRPLLIVPPWINKYYILDLRPENSFIRWAVEQGHTVFVISWVNPDERHAGKTFENYLLDGAIAAMEVVRQATGESSINTIGYCLGGTLLACANGYLSARGDDRIASSTYFTSLIDFEEVGDLGIFIDEEQLAKLEKRMREKGYLDGCNMATTFSMLRANDLVWPFYINNYLLGKPPVAFDLLYWNSDSTRMPAAMHVFYLRNMYQRNLLREPGGITLAGTSIDLTQVQTPSYFVAAREDHIAPWQSVFAGAGLIAGPVRFVLGESGHIAGIINPPRFNKYGYWTGSCSDGNAETWLEKALHTPGSWWVDWQSWMESHAGDRVEPRLPGGDRFRVIEDAPGSYVRMSLEE